MALTGLDTLPRAHPDSSGRALTRPETPWAAPAGRRRNDATCVYSAQGKEREDPRAYCPAWLRLLNNRFLGVCCPRTRGAEWRASLPHGPLPSRLQVLPKGFCLLKARPWAGWWGAVDGHSKHGQARGLVCGRVQTPGAEGGSAGVRSAGGQEALDRAAGILGS